MIVFVDGRVGVGQAYVSGFEREGMAAVQMTWEAFSDWLDTLGPDDMQSVTAILLGDGPARRRAAERLKRRGKVAVVAINDSKSLQETLELFAGGFDDVVSKPVHVTELIARINVIRARGAADRAVVKICGIQMFADGRDPVVGDAALLLPRRERRILECLASNRRAWLTKSKLFHQVYGLFSESADESVIESHICRLRRRLRDRLGFDPIESRRFLGYRLSESSKKADVVQAVLDRQTDASVVSA